MTSMKQVILKPNSTITNQVTDINAGMTAHGVLRDENLRTRLRTTHTIVGNKLVRVGFDDYTLGDNERVKAIRVASAFGQTIPAGFIRKVNNHGSMQWTQWTKRAFATSEMIVRIGPHPKVLGPWWYKNPATGAEWSQANINALEDYITFRDEPSGSWDVRLYEAEIRLWILEKPQTQGLSPAHGSTTQNNNPRFKWSFRQDGNSPEDAPQNRYEIRVWAKSVVEDTVTIFDPLTSAYIWTYQASTSSQDVPYPTSVPELAFGTEYYWGVRAANKFNGAIWWSDWSEPVLFKTNTPPVVDVTAPTGVITNTNRPLVQWTYADAEGEPQNRYSLKIFEEPVATTNRLRFHQSTIDPAEPSIGSPHFSPGGNMLIARETTLASHGTQSMRMTKTGSNGNMQFGTTSGTYPDFEPPIVVPGQQYTAIGRFRAATTGRSVRAVIWWLDEFETLLSVSNGTTVLDTTGGWTQAVVTATAPANAKYVKVRFEVLSAVVGEVHYVDEMGFSNGTNTTWAPGSGGVGGTWSELDPENEDRWPSVWQVEAVGTEALARMVGIPLPNNKTYRAYVKAAHKIVDTPPYLYGAWDFSEFTLTLTLPLAPTLTAEGAGDRVFLRMQHVDPPGAEPVPERFEIERSLDGGVTWSTFRYGSEALSVFYGAEQLVEIYDYEVPFFKDVMYRAFSVDESLGVDLYSLSSTVRTVQVGEHRIWIKDPADSDNNFSFRVSDGWFNFNRQRLTATHAPLGRRKPLVIRGENRSIEFNLGLLVLGQAEEAALERLLEVDRTLFIQTPRGSWYADVSGSVDSRMGFFDRRRGDQEVEQVIIPFQEVEYVPSQ